MSSQESRFGSVKVYPLKYCPIINFFKVSKTIECKISDTVFHVDTKLGVVGHTFNPSLQGNWVDLSEFKASLGCKIKN